MVEPESFRRAFEAHFAEIHRYLRARLGAATADDLAAEVFVRAWAARERYVPQSDSPRAWLYAIATNLARDEARRHRRGRNALARLPHEATPPAETAGSTDPELLAAVAELREEEREVLLLFAWADLGYAEIALATGVPEGTVRSRLHRARAQLQRVLTVDQELAR